jgi:hypothetical protein
VAPALSFVRLLNDSRIDSDIGEQCAADTLVQLGIDRRTVGSGGNEGKSYRSSAVATTPGQNGILSDAARGQPSNETLPSMSSAGRGGFDLIAQRMGGIMHVTGEPDGPPTSVGLPICDLGTGMWAVHGILAALYERQRTGKGRLVECSLLETAIGFSSWTSA